MSPALTRLLCGLSAPPMHHHRPQTADRRPQTTNYKLQTRPQSSPAHSPQPTPSPMPPHAPCNVARCPLVSPPTETEASLASKAPLIPSSPATLCFLHHLLSSSPFFPSPFPLSPPRQTSQLCFLVAAIIHRPSPGRRTEHHRACIPCPEQLHLAPRTI